LGLLNAADLTPGILRKDSGAAARAYVERATHDALKGEVAGIVTLPVNKEATRMSDPDFIGHTELIAQLCDVQNYSMMLVTDDVAVSHVSAHVPLTEAIRRVTKQRVRAVIELTHKTLSMGTENPRIAVCGLNPHAGENGLFGDEEKKFITPAIAETVVTGINVSGPYPADTIFHQAIHRNRYDAVICMYHDQGHAPMKLFDFESAVNVTIGLPIVRTSVDHGTAFDIAWKGTAFTNSLDHALRYARKLASKRHSI
jgi:4-hydroxythreonine-4-phosphate dehydrogenase